jgi:hypothetical protein
VRIADRFVKSMDANGDGVVTQEEFVAAAKARFASSTRTPTAISMPTR